MKTRTLLGLLAASIIGNTVLSHTGRTESACETYQGYGESDEDIYVFDPNPVYLRRGAPRFGLTGNSVFKDSLKIGQEYCFTLKDPVASWASKKLVSIRPSGRDLASNTPSENN